VRKIKTFGYSIFSNKSVLKLLDLDPGEPYGSKYRYIQIPKTGEKLSETRIFSRVRIRINFMRIQFVKKLQIRIRALKYSWIQVQGMIFPNTSIFTLNTRLKNIGFG